MTETNKNPEADKKKIVKLPRGMLLRILSFFFKDVSDEVDDEAGFICDGDVLTVSLTPKSVDPLTVIMEFYSLLILDDGKVGGLFTIICETTIPIAPGISLKGSESENKRGLIPEEKKAAALALFEELKVLYDQAADTPEVAPDTPTEAEISDDDGIDPDLFGKTT